MNEKTTDDQILQFRAKQLEKEREGLQTEISKLSKTNKYLEEEIHQSSKVNKENNIISFLILQ